jgi:quercetin dioxygenase-like cupin family protein
LAPESADLYGMKNSSNIKTDNTLKSDSSELEKARARIIVEVIEYIPNSVVSKTVLRKLTGSVSVMSFDTGEGLSEKISPFDTFIQIIEGKANIVIDKVSNLLQTGQGIIIPAHSSNLILPNGKFKLISTVIKSGYE